MSYLKICIHGFPLYGCPICAPKHRTPEETAALKIIGRMRGRIKSKRKAEASRRNGRLGGRPRVNREQRQTHGDTTPQ